MLARGRHAICPGPLPQCHFAVGYEAARDILARHIRCRSSQAVGQALKRNPFAPQVPCHRVVASDLSLGGFAGMRKGKETRRKQAMLADEGVLFKDGRLMDSSRIYRF